MNKLSILLLLLLWSGSTFSTVTAGAAKGVVLGLNSNQTELFTAKNLLGAAAIGGLFYYGYKNAHKEENPQKPVIRSVETQKPDQHEEDRVYTTSERLGFFAQGLGYALVSTVGLALVAQQCYTYYRKLLVEQEFNSLENLYAEAEVNDIKVTPELLDLQKEKESYILAGKIVYGLIPLGYSYLIYTYNLIQKADMNFKKAFLVKDTE